MNNLSHCKIKVILTSMPRDLLLDLCFKSMHMYNANVSNIYSNVIYLCVNEK